MKQRSSAFSFDDWLVACHFASLLESRPSLALLARHLCQVAIYFACCRHSFLSLSIVVVLGFQVITAGTFL